MKDFYLRLTAQTATKSIEDLFLNAKKTERNKVFEKALKDSIKDQNKIIKQAQKIRQNKLQS